MRAPLTVVLVLWSAAALAQTKPAASQKPAAPEFPQATALTDGEKALLLERADLLTAAIQEDASNLPPNLQFVLPGRLGELWRSVDPKRAQAWLEETVGKVLNAPQTESDDEHKTRMDAAAAFIRDWNKDNPAVTDRLLDGLIAQLPPITSSNRLAMLDRSTIGRAISGAILNTGSPPDSERIFSLGGRAIKVGAGNTFGAAYLTLRSLAPERACKAWSNGGIAGRERTITNAPSTSSTISRRKSAPISAGSVPGIRRPPGQFGTSTARATCRPRSN